MTDQQLTLAMPILCHESTGAQCCGCIVLECQGEVVSLKCNECGGVVGVLERNILEDLVSLIPDRQPGRFQDSSS